MGSLTAMKRGLATLAGTFGAACFADASFASRGREVFAGYCGHDVRWVQPPVEGLELLQVQVIHRHGARSLWAPLECWANRRDAPAETPPFTCDLPISITAGSGRPLTKRFDQPGGCGLGSLLGEAPLQFRNLAWSLNDSYQHTSLWKQLNLTNGNVYIYSCDNERNLASADLLISQLFAGGTPADDPVLVHTLPLKDDPFQLSGYVATSPCDGSPLPEIKAIKADKNYRAFASAWLHHANVSWNHMLYDCILTSRCAGLPLPDAISHKLADEALYWGWRQQMAAVRGTNWTSLVASRALEALAKQLKASEAPDGPKLALWSTHDSTMIYLLNALMGWDDRWPGYASSVILELYDGPSGRVLRALRDGKPLVLGVCGEVLCPLSRFLSVVDSWKDWGCASPPEVLDSLQASSPMQNSWPGIVALLGLLVCGALFWLRCLSHSTLTLAEPLLHD